MSMPMICAAALRASSAVFASLMPPALPRPPTGTCALTATGPSLEKAATASSGVRATMPGGIGMPSEASASLAWYSRSFKCLGRGGVEWARRGGFLWVGLPAVAEALLERRVVDQDDATDYQHQDHDECEAAPDQDGGEGDAPAPPRGLGTERPPRAAVPILKAVVGNPTALSVLSRHGLSVLAEPQAPGSVTKEECCRATSEIVCAPCASRCAGLESARCASAPARSRRRCSRARQRCKGWRSAPCTR